MATTGINASGIESAKTLLNEWQTSVNNIVNSGSTVKLQSSIKGTESELTAQRLEGEISEFLSTFFQSTMKDLDTALTNTVSNYTSNDSGNSSFSNVTNSIKS